MSWLDDEERKKKQQLEWKKQMEEGIMRLHRSGLKERIERIAKTIESRSLLRFRVDSGQQSIEIRTGFLGLATKYLHQEIRVEKKSCSDSFSIRDIENQVHIRFSFFGLEHEMKNESYKINYDKITDDVIMSWFERLSSGWIFK